VQAVPARHITEDERGDGQTADGDTADVCGADLWYYRGESERAVGSIGHECIGVVVDVYTAEPGSPSQDALNLLASWITTPSDLTSGAGD
jgi:hypothetical protein